MKRLARYGPREIVLRAWTLVWLMLVWTMLWGNFSVANTINGLLVALVIIIVVMVVIRRRKEITKDSKAELQDYIQETPRRARHSRRHE